MPRDAQDAPGIEVRELGAEDADALADIDRSEHVDGQYRVVDGALVLESRSFDAPGWNAAMLAHYVERLRSVLAEGGRAVGAWSEKRLAGFASLGADCVGGDPCFLSLDMLYVDRPHRGRGVGRTLVGRVAEMALSRGATALYVSATPTRATVEAYLRMGAVLLEVPDPVLLEYEPDDVHLRIDLSQ